MIIAYFDSDAVLLGYGDAYGAVENGPTAEGEWPGASYRRVFPYKPDNEPGQYYWDDVAGAFVSIMRRQRVTNSADAAVARAALDAQARGEQLPVDLVKALEVFLRSQKALPTA